MQRNHTPHIVLRETAIAISFGKLVTALARLCAPEPFPLSPRLQRDAGLIDELPCTAPEPAVREAAMQLLRRL